MSSIQKRTLTQNTMNAFTKFIFLSVVVSQIAVAKEPVARIGSTLLSATDLSLERTDPKMSKTESRIIKERNTRSLIAYLEQNSIKLYLDENGIEITRNEIDNKIDELLNRAYPTTGYSVDAYRQQVEKMSNILPLLEEYGKNPSRANTLYEEKYQKFLSKSEWEQLKNNYSEEAIQQLKKITNSPVPTNEDIRSAYENQAKTHLLNEKFLIAKKEGDIDYSEWQKSYFAKVNILDFNYFNKDYLTDLLGSSNESSH